MCTFPGLRLKPMPTSEMEAYREYTALGDLNGDFENLPPRGKLLRYFGKIALVLWEIAQVLWEIAQVLWENCSSTLGKLLRYFGKLLRYFGKINCLSPSQYLC